MSTHRLLNDLGEAAGAYQLLDPGNAGTIDRRGRNLAFVSLESAGTETRTLPAPTSVGQIVTLAMKADAGDITLTVTGGYDEGGTTSFVFSDPGQYLTLVSIESASGTFVWRILGSSVVPSGVSGSGFKIARGSTALDGSNATPVATGLTTIVCAVATLKRTSALSSGTAFVTVDYTGSDGTLNLYGWVAAGTASTGTENVEWIAIGT